MIVLKITYNVINKRKQKAKERNRSIKKCNRKQ